jgi:hypothetical protein
MMLPNRVSFSSLCSAFLLICVLLCAEHLSPLENSVISLSQGTGSIIDEVKYMTIRERSARNTNESTNARVLWWSIFETLVLISFSVWKMFYLRGFLESKGSSGGGSTNRRQL